MFSLFLISYLLYFAEFQESYLLIIILKEFQYASIYLIDAFHMPGMHYKLASGVFFVFFLVNSG